MIIKQELSVEGHTEAWQGEFNIVKKHIRDVDQRT